MSPIAVRDEWDAEDVQDALQILAAEGRYQLRHKFDRPGDIDARTGVPLE